MPPAAKPMLLAFDSTCELPVARLATALNATCTSLRFEGHSSPFYLGKPPISNPRTYEGIKGITDFLLKAHSAIVIATEMPYDNNYFFDSAGRVVITSFAGWAQLTNLARTNGLLGFVASILAEDIHSQAPRHDENTGCVYDFLWDKSGIDMRLRSGAVCRECLGRIQELLKVNGNRRLTCFDCTLADGFEDLRLLFDEVSAASRREVDILCYWDESVSPTDSFDTFLCHNSEDKASVRALCTQLVAKGIKPWFDEQQLAPGCVWQDELQATIPRIRSVLIIVGRNGRGPWQDIELRAFIAEFAKRRCRIIPVILADAQIVPELPLFLRQFMWVDFRRSDPPPFDRLLWGITGKKPS